MQGPQSSPAENLPFANNHDTVYWLVVGVNHGRFTGRHMPQRIQHQLSTLSIGYALWLLRQTVPLLPDSAQQLITLYLDGASREAMALALHAHRNTPGQLLRSKIIPELCRVLDLLTRTGDYSEAAFVASRLRPLSQAEHQYALAR
jgi:hypothetical protein